MSAGITPGFDPGFSTPEMTEAFSPSTFVEGMLAFEAALAAAQGDLGIIDEDAAADVQRVCRSLTVDAADLLEQGWEAGSPVIPLLGAIGHELGPAARPALHHGATSQDAIDTAAALQLRRGLELLRTAHDRLGEMLVDLADAERHREAKGRTLLQSARPTSRGLRFARWLQPFRSDLERLRAAEAGLPVQLGGPVGDQAPLGVAGQDLVDRLARDLDLAAAPVPWHTDRRPIIDAVAAAAATVRSTGKIAGDLVWLASVGEARMRSGGSSSMLDKRNPIDAVRARAAAAVCRPMASALLAGDPVELERGVGGWQSEWLIVPMVFHTAAAAVSATSRAVETLELPDAPPHESPAADSIIDAIITGYRERT